MDTTPRCAGVIILHPDGSTVLVQTERGRYSFPKGKRKKKEDHFDAACRELLEETGITIDKLEFIDDFYIDEMSDRGNPNIRYYVAKYIAEEKVIDFVFDPDELIKVGWFLFDDVFQLEKLKWQRKNIFKKVIGEFA